MHPGCGELYASSSLVQIHNQQHTNYQGGHDKIEYHRYGPERQEYIYQQPHDDYPLLNSGGTNLIEQ